MSHTMKLSLSIPYRSIWSIALLILVIPIIWVNFQWYLIPGFTEIFSHEAGSFTLGDINLMWIPPISYALISTAVCLMIRVIMPLKEYSEEGLIWGLVWGLIVGLILGLAGSLVGSLILGLIGEFIWGLIWGLFWGLILGLVYGLFGSD